MSSYDEFVQDPINAIEILTGYSLSFASFFNPEIGLAKSGVCGPTIWGSNSSKLISIT